MFKKLHNIWKMIKAIFRSASLVCILVYSCNPNRNPKNQATALDQIVDTSIAIIKDSSHIEYLVKEISFWEPTRSQLWEIDSIMKVASKDTSNYIRITDFRKFYKQYICYKDSTGDLLVYVNGFCHLIEFPTKDSIGNWKMVPFDWKTTILVVDDGSPCFWSMRINLTKKKYYDFIL